MAVAQVKNLMAEMKLKGMLAGLDKCLADATTESWSHAELLDSLIQSEYDFRESRRITNKIKAAKLKIQPSLEDFDFTAKRSITKTQIKDLYQLKWLSQGRPVLIIGQTGVGKTFIAQALALHACRNKHSALFMNLTTLLENLMLARSSGTYLKFRDKIAKPSLLVIDDFGMRKLNATEAQDLCEIIEERSINKSTVITTQLPLDHWAEVIPDPVINDAIIDRLIHGAVTLKITGESYRKVKAKKLDTGDTMQH